MLALGSYFDRDVQLPWTVEILRRKPQGDGYARVRLLYDLAMRHVEEVNGRDGARLRAALTRLGSFCIGSVAELPDALAMVFPQKCEANQKVVDYALERCGSYGMATLGGNFLYAGAIKFLGQHFDIDPQFPWAAKVLSEIGISAEQKTHRFHDEGLQQRELWTSGWGA